MRSNGSKTARVDGPVPRRTTTPSRFSHRTSSDSSRRRPGQNADAGDARRRASPDPFIIAVAAVSVEALVIVIGCSCSEACGFDSHYRPGSFVRFNSRPIMYGAVGSLVLSWSWTRQTGFISFFCLWIQLCNNLVQRLCAYNLP